MGKKKTTDKGEDYSNPVKKDDVHIGKNKGIKKDEMQGISREKFSVALEKKGSKQDLLQVCRENRIQEH